MEKKIINLYRPNSAIVNDAFDKVIVEVHMSKIEKSYQTFMVTGCNQQVGTTTNAINLSISMAVAGWKTILIDMDMRKAARYKRLNSNVEKGLAEYLDGQVALKDVINATNYEKLSYISCGSDIDSSVRLLCSSMMDELLGQLKNEFDYIILDMPSINATPDATILLPSVDGVILLAAMNETKKGELLDAVEKAKRYPEKLMGVVVNKTEMDEYARNVSDYDYFDKKKLQKKYGKKIRKNHTGGTEKDA